MLCRCNDCFSSYTNTVNNINHQISNLNYNLNLNKHDTAIIDSGCSGNYLRDDAPVVNRDTTSPSIIASTPNGSTIRSSCSALLPDTALPTQARKSTIFPGLTNQSLLSVGQFADAGYTS